MPAIGSPESPLHGVITINDATGVTITVTTAATYYDVKHATLTVAGPSNGMTITGADGTIAVPASGVGKYRVSATGVLLGANSATVDLRISRAGAAFTAANGNPITRSIMAATAVERSFAINGVVNVTAAENITLMCTSGTNADTVNFKRLVLTAERMGE